MIDLTSKLAKPLTVVATVAVVVGFLFVGGHVNWLLTAGAWTYWNSEFTMIGLALLWVYLLRHEHFTRFRNTILLANLIGLGAYVVMPVAPSWMVLREGFGASISHSAGFLATLANPFAAMPSLHAADALIVGVFLAVTCRRRVVRLLWALWPAWVWFCVIATANYSVTDVVAGIGVALTSVAVVSWTPQLVRRGRGHTVLSGIAER